MNANDMACMLLYLEMKGAKWDACKISTTTYKYTGWNLINDMYNGGIHLPIA